MRIRAPDFFIGAHAVEGRIVKVDRAAAFLRGKSIVDVVRMAERVGWRLELTAEEQKQLTRDQQEVDACAASPIVSYKP
jgi:hypothetical protein